MRDATVLLSSLSIWVLLLLGVPEIVLRNIGSPGERNIEMLARR